MLRYLILVATFIFLNSPLLQAQQYLWPTDSGQYLSSTFGETRSAHFHAGLDIKTWGEEGYRVFASRDGILYRILVTERGYGNALYLKHPDGSFTLYAHLQRFNASFQGIADSLRFPHYDFEMDAILDSLGIEVKQGDVIGYTGSTGIGPPHLHFEVRDSLERPINALSTGIRVLDNRPPVFSSILIEPLAAFSFVEGDPISKTFRPVEISNGDYNFGSINASGTIGVSVNVFDQANRVANAYAVYSLSLTHKGDTLFYEELNQFSYDEDQYMFLDRAAPFGSSRRGHQRLFQKDGPDIPFYKIVEPRSMIDTKLNEGQYRITASDYFGNRATALFTIANDSSTVTKASIKAKEIQTPISDWYWTENWASPDLEHILELDQQNIDGYPWSTTQQLVRKDSSTTVNYFRFTPGYDQKVTFPDGQLKIRYPSNAFYDTLTVATHHQVIEGQPYISIQPEMIPTAAHFGIEYYLGDLFQAGNSYRLFKIDSKDGDLSYIDSELIGRTVHARSNELGEFTVIADNEAPAITDFQFYKTDFGAWRASVHVEDTLTGINSSTAEFVINGTRGIAEYDYEEEILIYYLPNFVPEKRNSASIKLKDKAGNLRSINFEMDHPSN